jgi:hypothetical protein
MSYQKPGRIRKASKNVASKGAAKSDYAAKQQQVGAAQQ